MTVASLLEVKGGDTRGAIGAFLSRLLEAGLARAILVPRWLPGGEGVVQALVRGKAELEGADPLAPVLPVSGAKLVSALTASGIEGKVAVVLRGCEIRALIELGKLHQARLESLLIVGLDCLGTYEVADFAEMVRAGLLPTQEAGPIAGYSFRAACRMCGELAPTRADISLGFIGLDKSQTILVQTTDELAERLELRPAEVPPEREKALAELLQGRRKTRELLYEEFRARVKDLPSLVAEFAACTGCYNCMVACPLCYCKECIFRTAVFDHPSAQYLRWVERKGVIRMPADTLLFHLTRLNHMVTSCVGCGMCESACPSHIPLATIFSAIGERVQALFGYVPGRDPAEEMPLATFREEELEKVGR